jgi:hypothetical protein
LALAIETRRAVPFVGPAPGWNSAKLTECVGWDESDAHSVVLDARSELANSPNGK